MKVAYDYQTFILQAYGGISRYFVKLCEELTKDAEEVRIFAPYHCNQLLGALNKSIITGKKIASNEFSKPKALAIMILNQSLSRRTIGNWKPDLVHETYYSIRRSAPRKFPVITTVYDMIHERLPQHFHKADPTSFLKRLTIKRADHIICISESTKRDLIELFPFVESKISVVHLGVSLFDAKKNDFLVDKPYLLYVGSRNGHKNFSNLVRSFANLEKLRSNFDLIAFGGGSFTATELNAFNNFGFKQTQIRQISGDDSLLAMVYRKASAFIYPSFYEGFGLPPLEAMAQDCPVVSSNSSSMPEVIGDAGEYFDPTSTEQMAEAIERVVFSQSRREQLVKLGKKRLEIFTWKNCADKTNQVYHQLVDRN
jgi:glycosyltransferase involved in cell wall biosynthesis